MLSENGGRNSYATYLTQKDVTKAIKKAREVQDNAQAVADQSKRTRMGSSKELTSNKRKGDASPSPSPFAASVASTETLRKSPDNTPGPTEQDLPSKKFPVVSASSYVEKARLQRTPSLGSLKALSGPAMPINDLQGAIYSLRPGT